MGITWNWTHRPDDDGGVPTLPNEADAIVQERFEDSQTYAESAYTQALAALNDIADLDAFTDELATITFEVTPVQIETTDVVAPDTPTITIDMPSPPDDSGVSYQEDGDYDSLNTAYLDKLYDDLINGGTGLSSDVEDAIYERQRQRIEQEYLDLEAQIEGENEARRWFLPNGSRDARLDEMSARRIQALADHGRDTMIKQAELAQANTLNNLERIYTYLGAIWEDLKGRSLFTIEKFKALVDEYKAKVSSAIEEAKTESDIYENEVKAYVAKIEGISKDIGAQVEIVKAETDRLKANADIQLKSAEISLQSGLAAAELAMKKLDAVARVAAQLAASAWASVHASASIGQSLGKHYSHGYSFSQGESRSYNVSESETRQYTGDD